MCFQFLNTIVHWSFANVLMGFMWNFGKSYRCPWKVIETQTICSKWLIAVKSTKKSYIIRQIYSLDLANRKCAANDKLKSALSKLLTPLMELHAYNGKIGYRFLIAHRGSVLNYGNLYLRAFTNANRESHAFNLDSCNIGDTFMDFAHACTFCRIQIAMPGGNEFEHTQKEREREKNHTFCCTARRLLFLFIFRQPILFDNGYIFFLHIFQRFARFRFLNSTLNGIFFLYAHFKKAFKMLFRRLNTFRTTFNLIFQWKYLQHISIFIRLLYAIDNAKYTRLSSFFFSSIIYAMLTAIIY